MSEHFRANVSKWLLTSVIIIILFLIHGKFYFKLTKIDLVDMVIKNTYN